MITSTIKFSQIEDRVDAEYYKPEYLEIETQLCNSANLENYLTKLETGSWVEKHCFSNGLIPYIKVEQVKDIFLEKSEEKISIECSKNFNNPLLDKEDILLSRVGTVGVASIFLDDTKSTFSDNVIRLKIKNLNPFYLVIFLNSKFGRSQIERLTKQALQGVINYQSIKTIKIPIPPESFQQKIEKMVKEAQEKRELAEKKYKEAEEILNKELGLENLDLSTQKTFEARFSETIDKVDSEYYQPKYKKIENLIKKNKFEKKPLKFFVKKYNCGFAFPTEIYLEKGIPLLRIKNLKKMEIDFEGVEFLPDLKEYQEFVASPGDILISMSGTVGMASLVPGNIPKAFVNQRITSITTEGIEKLYLCLYLNLPAINSLMTKETTGGVQKNITYQDIVSVLVPILPQKIQQKISSLIQESFKLRKEAKALIETAKRAVEEMVIRK